MVTLVCHYTFSLKVLGRLVRPFHLFDPQFTFWRDLLCLFSEPAGPHTAVLVFADYQPHPAVTFTPSTTHLQSLGQVFFNGTKSILSVPSQVLFSFGKEKVSSVHFHTSQH